MSWIFYAVAGVLFGTALLLFWGFDVYKIVGDLSGRNAKKEIKAIGKRKREKSVWSDFEIGETGFMEKRVRTEGLGTEEFVLIEKLEFIGSSSWIE